MNLKSNLICFICKKILEKPIILPCKCIICKEHLKDDNVKNSVIQCLECHKSFNLPESGFPPHVSIEIILKRELHLTKKEASLKTSIQNKIEQLERVLIA